MRYIDPEELRSEIAPRETRTANTLDMSAGARLGIVRSYGYGESRPELRPLVTD